MELVLAGGVLLAFVVVEVEVASVVEGVEDSPQEQGQHFGYVGSYQAQADRGEWDMEEVVLLPLE